MMRTAAGVGRSAAREAIADLGCAAMHRSRLMSVGFDH
ncbi:hypothetical protein MUK42_15761 [Musa troglodytarum]|uniref:Uncharacterized protein n=1 Tax=Musa troglodytarum TaxID=320322 RepID=A0A9E7HN51_9LILI|nr:hypothetical protein MUK42_15761 [Musa troglodytarum]